MILHIPGNLIYNKINVTIRADTLVLCTWEGIPGHDLIRMPFKIPSSLSKLQSVALIKVSGRSTIYLTTTEIIILEHKNNEVKADRITGGLIVNDKPFFPFGFYCYSPVYPTLPEEEITRGFNLMSPYQRILPETFSERKAYMDRCAQLGMKVHYNLLSLSGGGGVDSRINGITEEQKKELLVKEIMAFRDHPALLAWYISDEPTGNKISPEYLESIYKTVKDADPWHPVSIVFMAPFMSAARYAGALDIVMADPYPIPSGPATMAGDVARRLSETFRGKNPVWIVPQAFGGGEWWEREPSLQELRAMTYQAVINGARGIQYFVRQGPNLFPKSTASWGECGRMALEIAELTPWLLSDEKNIEVRSTNTNVIVTSAVHNNKLMIMAANRNNSPVTTGFSIGGRTYGRIRVIFENRTISSTQGYFSDYLSAYGTQVYMVDLKSTIEDVRPYPGNLLLDPGFEITTSTGIPSACYARSGGDRGATFFIDTRDHFEGEHSLRLISPSEDKGVRLRFFPVTVLKGQTYFISVRAKTDSATVVPRKFRITFGDYESKYFNLTDDWKEFITNVTIPFYTDLSPRVNVILQMYSKGVAWFDLLQVFKAEDINRSINPDLTDDWNFYHK